MKFKKILLILTVFLILSPSKTAAQEFSLTMEPQKQKILIQPGKTIKLNFVIENKKDPIFVQAKVHQLKIEDNKGSLTLLNKKNSSNIKFKSLHDNYSLNHPFLLTQNEGLVFPIQVTIPENTEETDFIYAFIIETIPQKKLEGEVYVDINAGISSTLIFQVSKKGYDYKDFYINTFYIDPQYKLNLFGTSYKIFDKKSNIPIKIKVFNKGKHAVNIEGTVLINNLLGGNQIYELESSHVFPEKARILHKNSNSYNDKDDTLVIKDLKTGYYKITTTIFDERKIKTETKTDIFLVIPVKFAIFLIFSLFLIIAIIIGIRIKQAEIQKYLERQRRKKQRVSPFK